MSNFVDSEVKVVTGNVSEMHINDTDCSFDKIKENSKKITYREMVLRSSTIVIKTDLEEKGRKQHNNASKQNWKPSIVVTKTSYLRSNRKYGPQPDTYQIDEGKKVFYYIMYP